jgi:uncharacterized protein (TIGR03643 family)
MEQGMTTWTSEEMDRLIQMAWEDRTPFEAIEMQFGLVESQVIDMMRQWMRPSSYRMWRKRMHGRSTKHQSRNTANTFRFKCSRQRQISNNKISKR